MRVMHIILLGEYNNTYVCMCVGVYVCDAQYIAR